MSAAPSRRVALKVDCDTYEGTAAGIPNLLRLFDTEGIRASFFFTLGPDHSGRAAFRVFTQKGFLKKMLRSNALSLYGPKTMLYGTLLPGPRIGRKLASVIRSVGDAGHEVGVHGWDHVRWHDRLDKLSEPQIEADVERAHEVFEEIFRRKARCSAAPGWHATAVSLAVQEKRGLLYASDTRGGAPFFPEAGGRRFATLEIPTTLPTWDEVLGTPELKEEKALVGHYDGLVRGTEVHSIHTEVEGTALLGLFGSQVEAWKASGVAFTALEDIAKEQLAKKESIPVRRLVRTTLPGRGGLITSSEAAA